ncbi:Phenoxybenzoate dioxygenase subunit beta [Variovorax sp. PBS-H4]|uniref:PDR/VanB family oxidoreductase n=1 Tax=Variovorax sp. PBS-H4 TaxID=434008 RepID=UPI0013167A74|nr:PDR/VanB family oxidoreductase [Variovorax sp. PBS-H4]VTU38675.1 Phenoxybenzoate dioxygenase subunit beta [Variovorax sp. PBS-H4]
MNSEIHWMPARITACRDLTPTVREFELTPESGLAASHEPGSHLQVQVLVGTTGAGRMQTRHYSLVGEPDGRTWRIAVKRLDDGRGGSLAMWRLAPGDRLLVTQPQNHFGLDITAPGYLLVAGGIGITPMVFMAQRLGALAARRGVAVRLLYGARSEKELAYLASLQAALGSAATSSIQTHIGHAPIDFAAEIAALPEGGQLYTCGPVPMLEAVKRAWAAAGRPPADLRFETFGSSGRLPVQAFEVRIPRHDLSIQVPAESSLLEALEAAGVQTLWDCRRGECGLCAMDVLAVEGEIDHRDVFLSEQEKREGRRICACVSRAVGCITLDSAWRPDTP